MLLEKRFWILSLTILSILVLLLTTVISAKTTITLMRDAAEMPDEVVKKFEELNPDIEVNIVENDFTKLMTMIAGGTPPDIFRINGIGLPYWVRKGLVVDITPYLEKTIDMNDLFLVNNLFQCLIA